ncbi:MAG: hypothetical protein ACJ71F_19110 [Nitrososphaeraceae archaeon]|jgi:hypothetical protein
MLLLHVIEMQIKKPIQHRNNFCPFGVILYLDTLGILHTDDVLAMFSSSTRPSLSMAPPNEELGAAYSYFEFL